MYKVEIKCAPDWSFDASAADNHFKIDLKGRAVTPLDVLLAGLGSCMGVYIRKYAEGAKLDLGEFTVEVESELPKEPPLYFKEIKVSIDLKGLLFDQRRKTALLEFIKNCPVHNTLKNNPEVHAEII